MGQFYLVKGKIKSGKSSLLKAFMCAIIAGQWNRVKSFLKNGKILYFDTEQKPQDCQSILTYCKTMTGCSDEYLDEHVMLFSVRKRERSLLMDDLAMQVSDWKPDLIIVDGLADCVRSFNDEVECSEFVHRLLCIVEDNDCALIGLIHENKASDDFNPKGHLGSLSQQKAAMIFETRKVGDIIKVTTSAARHKSMPDWSYISTVVKKPQPVPLTELIQPLPSSEVKKYLSPASTFWQWMTGACKEKLQLNEADLTRVYEDLSFGSKIA